MQSLFDRAQLARLHAQVVGQPVDIPALLKAADAALVEERFGDAEILLRGAIISGPDRSETWHRLGRLAEAYGEIDEATEAYRRAMELQEDEAVALDLARLLLSSGDFEEAEALAGWLALQANDPDIRRSASILANTIDRREARHAAR